MWKTQGETLGKSSTHGEFFTSNCGWIPTVKLYWKDPTFAGKIMQNLQWICIRSTTINQPHLSSWRNVSSNSNPSLHSDQTFKTYQDISRHGTQPFWPNHGQAIGASLRGSNRQTVKLRSAMAVVGLSKRSTCTNQKCSQRKRTLIDHPRNFENDQRFLFR